MKKLLLLLAIITLASCDHIIHADHPLIIKEISDDFNGCIGSEGAKYRLTIKSSHDNEILYVFTDEKFNVGDTLK